MTATPNPLAGKPGWHWFIPRAEATIAYLAKHGLEIRGDRKVMTMMELKVGDIVKLKTGGPEMTVNRVGPCGKHDHIDYIPAGEVQAAWFSPAVVRSGWNGAFSDVFGADALEKVDQCAADLLDPPLGRDGEVKETAPAEKEEAA